MYPAEVHVSVVTRSAPSAASSAEEEEIIATGFRHSGGFNLEPDRREDIYLEAQNIGGLQPGIEDVVCVSDPGYGLSLDWASFFLESQNVTHDLTGMIIIGQAIDDRDFGIVGKLLKTGLLKGSNHDHIDHSGKDLGRIRQRTHC